MAENRRYGTNGAAAYDVYPTSIAIRNGTENYCDGSAVRQPAAQGLPGGAHAPGAPSARQGQDGGRAVYAVRHGGGGSDAGARHFFGYVQLFEATTRVGELQSQLNELTAQQTLLESKYESKIDLRSCSSGRRSWACLRQETIR